MIKKFKLKIFLLLLLMPLTIIFLIITAYNISHISFIINDEKETLRYCADCVLEFPKQIDAYLQVPTEDLIEISQSRNDANAKVSNLLYAIISSDLCIAKISSSNVIEGINGNEDLFNILESSLESIVTQAKIENQIGHMYKIRYTTVKASSSIYVIILSTAGWTYEIRRTILLSTLGLLIAIIALGIVAYTLSKTLTAPIEVALIKQNHFIADASHELKTPLSVINANVAVLERTYGENKWMDYIKEESSNMTLLINQLLSLCRLDYSLDNKESCFYQQKEVFDVFDSIMEASLPFDALAFEKGVEIDINAEHLTSSGNVSEFKQILSILIDNAITHVNRNGALSVTVTKRSKAAFSMQQSPLYVEVANSGSTISAEDLPYIFDRFYKSRTSNSDTGNNFGLGLSIAKGLADKNGYDLSAFSKENTTVFRLRIPQAKG